jgi:integrase
VRSFLEAVRGDRLEALYVLAISTGMRQGELLGLRWQDVDVERRRLQLVRQLKTRQSRRAVVLSELAVTALIDHRDRQAAEHEQQGCAGRSMAWSLPTPWAGRWTRITCAAELLSAA